MDFTTAQSGSADRPSPGSLASVAQSWRRVTARPWIRFAPPAFNPSGGVHACDSSLVLSLLALSTLDTRSAGPAARSGRRPPGAPPLDSVGDARERAAAPVPRLEGSATRPRAACRWAGSSSRPLPTAAASGRRSSSSPRCGAAPGRRRALAAGRSRRRGDGGRGGARRRRRWCSSGPGATSSPGRSAGTRSRRRSVCPTRRRSSSWSSAGPASLTRSGTRRAGSSSGARTGRPATPTGSTIQVQRKLTDGVPLLLTTRIVLDVAGKAREVVLGRALPPGFTPLQLDAPLAARVEPDGRLRGPAATRQVGLPLVARSDGPIASVARPDPAGPWTEGDETWVFEAAPAVRVVTLEGLPAVDPSQTQLPPEWRALPAFAVRTGEALRLVEQRRGNAEPEPDQLTLDRQLWLDTDGRGWTFQDRLGGELRRSWRLEMPGTGHPRTGGGAGAGPAADPARARRSTRGRGAPGGAGPDRRRTGGPRGWPPPRGGLGARLHPGRGAGAPAAGLEPARRHRRGRGPGHVDPALVTSRPLSRPGARARHRAAVRLAESARSRWWRWC